MRLSPATKALLSEARADAPSTTSRANVWAGISGTLGAVAGATSVASSAGGTGAKALLFGTLLGGTATVGLALVLLRFGPTPPAPQREATAMHVATVRGPAPTLDSRPRPDPGARAIATISSATATGNLRATSGSGPLPAAFRHASPRTTPALAVDDPLAHEALLVSAARTALARGDARSALRAIREAGALPSRQLAPEELAVESQALRSLGRDAEAKSVGDLLKAQYPESALAR